MSLINDALKQARKTPPRNTPNALPPLPPDADEASSLPGWLLPVVVIALIVAAIFLTGWAVSHHTVHAIVVAPPASGDTQDVAVVSPPVEPPKPADPVPAVPPDAPKLQGIDYSRTAPSAILDGKTVRPGDQIGQYHVKEISKYSVTLVGPDKKEIKLGMGN
jgi:hypothetical protein